MTPPTRVIMTVDTIGGVWTYAIELARGLVPLGYELWLVVLGPAPSPAQRASADAIAGVRIIDTGLPLDWLAPNAGAVQLSAGVIAALARYADAAIIHLNQPALAGVADYPAPVVTVLHSCVETWWRAAGQGDRPAEFGWQTDLVRAGLLAADRAICPSDAFAAAAAAAYALPATPAVVYNGRTPLPPVRLAVQDCAITAGRLWDKGKNLATIDRAASRLAIPVTAFGPLSGPNGERIAFDHLHAPGVVDEESLAAQYAARPLFVSAALYEPFGLSALEAASAGCPLILSDIPTFRELWDGAAIFVDAHDDAGFARAIAQLIDDPVERRVWGDRARAAAAHYSPARMAAAMAAIYQEVLPTTASRVAA